MAKKSDNGLLTSVLYIVIGALLIVFRNEMLEWAMTIAGIFFLVFGVLELIKLNFLGGAISIIIGIVVLILGWTVVDIVLLVLGILLAIKGVIALIGAFGSRKNKVLKIVLALLTVVVGLIVAFGNALGYVVIIAGAMLIVDGVFGLIAAAKK